MRDLFDSLFGTSEPPEERSVIAIGPLSFEQSELATRTIAWLGVELVRAIDYPVRDKDWGTWPTRTISTSQQAEVSFFHLTRDFETDDTSIAGRFELTATIEGKLTFFLRLAINRDTEVCRLGFTILHPIAGLAGQVANLQRRDGETFDAEFPQSISPGKPATDFVAVRYPIGAVSVSIDMMNSVFEIEDQRNWSDASYKTYVTTASFPEPYFVRKGEVFEQTVTMAFSGANAIRSSLTETPVLSFEPSIDSTFFPDIAFAVDTAWGKAITPPSLTSLRRVVRIDLRRPVNFDVLDFARPGGPASLDLELILSNERQDAEREIEGFVGALAKLGATPEHVIALPAAYLRSYQPDGRWPIGLSPSDAIGLARKAFSTAKIGGGALTNFTELNRCRPNAEQIDYLTHGSSAIVHAADDSSVFQTLEALPDIFRSATQIAGGKAYRLGLVSIGMRENPYGNGLAPNKERRRRTTCSFDPRARGLFGASWLVGVAAATEFVQVELITLASLGGPFAVADSHVLTPSYHVLASLARMQGRRRWRVASGSKAFHAVAVETNAGVAAIISNGTGVRRTLSCARKGRAAILDGHAVAAASEDPFWTKSAAAEFQGSIELPPYAVAFLDLAALGGE